MKPEGPVMHEDGFLAAKLYATPGACVFCEEPLRGRQQTLCSSEECRDARKRTHKRDVAVATASPTYRPMPSYRQRASRFDLHPEVRP